MIGIHGRIRRLALLMYLLCTVLLTGCHSMSKQPRDPAFGIDRLPPVYQSMPRELSKVVLPEYVIEPPDILMIEGIHIVPKAPYQLRALECCGRSVAKKECCGTPARAFN